MSVPERQLASSDARDLTLVPVRAEHFVDRAQPVDGAVDLVSADLVVADVENDRHPHDVLDTPEAGQGGGDSAHARLALRIADWSEPANASLVYVAPETRSILALCALKASLRRIGMAVWLMYRE